MLYVSRNNFYRNLYRQIIGYPIERLPLPSSNNIHIELFFFAEFAHFVSMDNNSMQVAPYVSKPCIMGRSV